MENVDFQVDGEYSPISLAKALDYISWKDDENFKVLVDSSTLGIELDDPSVLYITPEECYNQAQYIRENFFPDKLPDYLIEYLHFLYYGDELPVKDENLDAIFSLVKYCKTNKEAAQLIGLITLFHDTLLLAYHYKTKPRLLIEQPETHLHPQRTARIMYLLNKIKNKFSTPLNEE